MPGRSVRVSKKKSSKVEVTQEIRVGTLSYRTETYRRKFRRYIQTGDAVVYFKEYGDPTVVSSKTGLSFGSIEELKLKEPDIEPANEVLHFKIDSLLNGAYGTPRWIGNLLSVLGSRSAEEVNFAYFENKSIPPMAILVSGGRLGSESVKRIQDFVETQIKGKKNFHKILVIEAETSAGAIGLSDTAGAMRVEIKQLTDAQLKDGLFLEYDAANLDKVGMGFRLPRLLRGDIRDFNRASAEAALDFCESQVFVPLRNDFDFTMDRCILPAIGIKLYKFKSLGPRLSDAITWGEMITKLVVCGVLTPEDGRSLTGKKIIGMELPKIEADWVKQPIALTIAGIQPDGMIDGMIPSVNQVTGASPLANDPTKVVDATASGPVPLSVMLAQKKQKLLATAKNLLNIRDAFRTQEAAEAVERYKKERVEEGELVFQMDAGELERRFNITRK